jgi:membrane protein YdbS with pleckstrin-like domain
MVLEREPGYFFGAMYFSYGMSVAILVPLYFLLQWLLPSWSEYYVVLLAALGYLPLVPLVFRYSRVMWIHLDRSAAPSELSTHSGWMEWRRREEGEKDPEP